MARNEVYQVGWKKFDDVTGLKGLIVDDSDCLIPCNMYDGTAIYVVPAGKVLNIFAVRTKPGSNTNFGGMIGYADNSAMTTNWVPLTPIPKYIATTDAAAGCIENDIPILASIPAGKYPGIKSIDQSGNYIYAAFGIIFAFEEDAA